MINSTVSWKIAKWSHLTFDESFWHENSNVLWTSINSIVKMKNETFLIFDTLICYEKHCLILHDEFLLIKMNSRKSTKIHLFNEQSQFNNWIWVPLHHSIIYFSELRLVARSQTMFTNLVWNDNIIFSKELEVLGHFNIINKFPMVIFPQRAIWYAVVHP